MRYINVGKTLWQHENQSGSTEDKFFKKWVAAGISVDPYVPEPTPDPADEVEDEMTQNKFIRAWVKREARKESKTPREIMNEIRADA